MGAASINVIHGDMGTFFFIRPFTMGIIPQSHIGNNMPAKAAMVQLKKIFSGNNLRILSFDMKTCIKAEIKLPSNINGKLSMRMLIKTV